MSPLGFVLFTCLSILFPLPCLLLDYLNIFFIYCRNIKLGLAFRIAVKRHSLPRDDSVATSSKLKNDHSTLRDIFLFCSLMFP